MKWRPPTQCVIHINEERDDNTGRFGIFERTTGTQEKW